MQVEFSNELFTFNWDEKEWKMLQEGSEDGDAEEGKKMPPRRHFHSAIMFSPPDRLSPAPVEPLLMLAHSDSEYMIVFGGKSNGYHNDIWKYDLCKRACYPLPFRIESHSCLDQAMTVGSRSSLQRVPDLPLADMDTLRCCTRETCLSMVALIVTPSSVLTCGHSRSVSTLSLLLPL